MACALDSEKAHRSVSRWALYGACFTSPNAEQPFSVGATLVKLAADEIAPTILTIGHSTRTLDEFLGLLKRFRIDLLVDVRTVPRSRHVPHFNGDSLAHVLRDHGIGYFHLKLLGGLRKPLKDSSNLGWRNLSFRGFADYMQTEEFGQGLKFLLELCAEKRSVLMCAEAVPWRCHRSLIADALLVRGIKMRHIISEKSFRLHELTPFAVLETDRVTYPETKGS